MVNPNDRKIMPGPGKDLKLSRNFKELQNKSDKKLSQNSSDGIREGTEDVKSAALSLIPAQDEIPCRRILKMISPEERRRLSCRTDRMTQESEVPATTDTAMPKIRSWSELLADAVLIAKAKGEKQKAKPMEDIPRRRTLHRFDYASGKYLSKCEDEIPKKESQKISAGQESDSGDSEGIRRKQQAVDGPASVNDLKQQDVAWVLSISYTEISMATKDGSKLLPILDKLSSSIRLLQMISLMSSEDADALAETLTALRTSLLTSQSDLEDRFSQLDDQMASLGAKNWTGQGGFRLQPCSIAEVFVRLKTYKNTWFQDHVDMSKLSASGSHAFNNAIDKLGTILALIDETCGHWKNTSRDVQMRCDRVSGDSAAMASHFSENSTTIRRIKMEAITTVLADIEKNIDNISDAITASEEEIKSFKANLGNFVLSRMEFF